MIVAAIWAKNQDQKQSLSISMDSWTQECLSISVKLPFSKHVQDDPDPKTTWPSFSPSPRIQKGHRLPVQRSAGRLCGPVRKKRPVEKSLKASCWAKYLWTVTWISSIILSFKDESICLKRIISWFLYTFFVKEKADQLCAGQSLTKYSIYNTAHILGRSWNLGTNVTNVQNFWGVEACCK